MSQGLWVEHKTDIKTCIAWIPIKKYQFVGQIIGKVKKDTQLAIPKNAEVTLHSSSGTAISVGDPISPLVPGNSFTNPLRVQVSPLPLTTIKPVSDPKLTLFWNSLHGLQDKGKLLRFPVRPKFIPVHLKRLYIRESYKDLFNIIWKNQKSKDLTKRLHRMAITGTPGIGKSVFLFYVMWRLANMKTTKTVILHRRAHKRRIYIFQNEGCWRTRKISDIDDLLDDPKTWYLTDALKPPPEERDSITILVSSPAGKYYETFIMYAGTAPLYYLPTWSLEELNIAAPYFGVKPQLVESRFDKIGGIPRYVLEKDEDLGVRIKRSLGKLALDKLESIALGEVSKEDESVI